MSRDEPKLELPRPTALEIHESIDELRRSYADSYPPRQSIDAVLSAGIDARALLPILIAGDPLELRSSACARLVAHARILDPNRLFFAAIARVAHRAGADPSTKRDGAWIKRCIDDAIYDCLRLDEEFERTLAPIDAESYAAYAVMAELLGFDILRARIAMLTFNRLPGPVRQICRAVLLRGTSLDQLVEQDLGSLEQVKFLFRHGMQALHDARTGEIPAPSPDETRRSLEPDEGEPDR